MKEWDWEHNKDLDPEKITLGSNKRANWVCKKGHRWSMTIVHRSGGVGCPYCSGRMATPENNLKVAYPAIAKEWDYEKNKEIKPEDIKPQSEKVVFWKCPKCGMSYDARVRNRTIAHSGCPYCAGKKVSAGVTDLASTHPELMDKWDWQHNTAIGLNPMEIGSGSHIKAWWRCDICGKSYIREVFLQVNAKGSCPYCKRIKNDRNHSFYYI